jgi:hypothetical protein
VLCLIVCMLTLLEKLRRVSRGQASPAGFPAVRDCHCGRFLGGCWRVRFQARSWHPFQATSIRASRHFTKGCRTAAGGFTKSDAAARTPRRGAPIHPARPRLDLSV